MRSEYYPLVARAGWWLLLPLLAGGVYLGAGYGWLLSLPLWLLAALAAFLFRDPERTVPAKPLGLVSPVDGRLLSVREARDPYLQRSACCLLFRGALSGSYTVRSPMEGKLVKQWYAAPEESAERRSLLASMIRSDEGDEIVLVVYPRLAWPRIRSNIGPGERVGQGMRFCYVPLGAKAELWVAAGTHIEAQPGRRVLAGSDVVGMLNHEA